VPAVNRFTFDATLRGREDLRHTPAGIPAIECTLDHRSRQQEAGGERNVECELHAVAFGEVALALQRCAIGSALRCGGFIARRYRTGTSVALHVTRFEQIETIEDN
jgi:primosomal replication protein N